jgi:hypothetical protein
MLQKEPCIEGEFSGGGMQSGTVPGVLFQGHALSSGARSLDSHITINDQVNQIALTKNVLTYKLS